MPRKKGKSRGRKSTRKRRNYHSGIGGVKRSTGKKRKRNYYSGSTKSKSRSLAKQDYYNNAMLFFLLTIVLVVSVVAGFSPVLESYIWVKYLIILVVFLKGVWCYLKSK